MAQETAAFRASDVAINRDDVEMQDNERHGVTTGGDNHTSDHTGVKYGALE